MAKFKAYFKSLKDYRHWIMIAAIVASLVLIPFFFRYAHLRIWESLVAFGTSFKYYISELLGLDLHGEIAVNDFTEQPFDLPFHLPRTWEEFKINMGGYWGLFFSEENFSAYMGKVSNVLLYVTKFILIVMPVFLIGVIVNMCSKPKVNNDYAKESKALRCFKRFEIKVCKPVKGWFVDFFGFVLDNKYYFKILAWIWAYSFNIISIVISFFAYYLYFIAALKTATLYIQLVKLLMDLSVMFNFIPGVLWVVIIVVALNKFAIKIGYDRLQHHERQNRGFLNERGVSTVVDGPMGSGKTELISDWSLSSEVQERDDALDIIMENDFYFPNFPWVRLQRFLKKMFEKHRIYDVDSCRRVIKSKFLKWKRKPCIKNLFCYNYEMYSLTYNDNLEVISIWQAIEDYACAYYIYTRTCSLMIASYSIRSDNVMIDVGDFPLWDCDFFQRDCRTAESISRRSHIIDYNMLRLGSVMEENDPLRYAFGFGVYTITEIDKERSNSKKITAKKKEKEKEKGKSAAAAVSECNQENDLFDLNLMMCRHAVTISNRCFLKFFGDLQRFEELGISTLGLGEKVSIVEKTERTPVLPFFSTFWLFDLVAGFIINKFDKRYLDFINLRGDTTLPMYLMKNFVAALKAHRDRVNKLFGCCKYTLSVAQGNFEPKKKHYYLQTKKTRSARFSTDCMSGIYEARAKLNNVSIDEIREYGGIKATDEELQMQYSFFQRDVHKALEKQEKSEG